MSKFHDLLSSVSTYQQKMTGTLTIDFETWFIFILLCLFSLLSYFVIFKKKQVTNGLNPPPSPPSLPIIGHLHLIIYAQAYKSLQKISSKYGPLLHIRVFNVRVILVSSAKVVYEIFREHDVNVSSRGVVAVDESLLLGTSGFTTAPYGDYWKFIKKLTATKMLRAQAIEQTQNVREEELKRFYETLLDKARRNESVEIGNEVTKPINAVMCRMTMGRSFSEENGEAERVRSLVGEVSALTKKVLLGILLRKPFEKFGISLFKKDIMSVSDRFNEIIEKVLEERINKVEEEHENGGDMMDVLLSAYQDKNAEFKITRDHIKSFFTEVFIVSAETSVETIRWTMAEILNKPTILERLRDEIESVVGKTRLIQETDLPNLPYLQAVVKEALRLHPTTPLLVRSFEERCEVRGYNIEEKTPLVINAYAVMRDPEFWEDPDEFKPERFLASLKGEEKDEREGAAMKYLAFGGGRRGCPGAKLAYILVDTAVGLMVQCFEWRVNGGKNKIEMKETTLGTNTAMANPPHYTFVPTTHIHL